MTPSQPLLNPAKQAQARWQSQLADWQGAQGFEATRLASQQQALAGFAEAALPTARDEDWKYTRLNKLWSAQLQLANKAGAVVAEGLNWADIGVVLTFVDGFFLSADSTAPANWPAGLTMTTSLSASMPAVDALQSMAQASAASTTQLQIKGQIEQPIIIRQQASSQHVASCAVQIVLAANSEAMVLEVVTGQAESLLMSQVSMDIGANAQLTHYLYQGADKTAHVLAWREANLSRDARFVQRSLSVGALVARQQMSVNVLGENASSDMGTANIGTDKQIQDMRTHTRHAVPHANSQQLHRMLLNGQANGVFHGDILVEKGADKTDANMATNNLMLSSTAQANSKPQLEIYADDVRCTHGVTSGQLDEQQIFYLRSRGIPADKARALVAAAFAQAAVADVRIPAVASWWHQQIENAIKA